MLPLIRACHVSAFSFSALSADHHNMPWSETSPLIGARHYRDVLSCTVYDQFIRAGSTGEPCHHERRVVRRVAIH